MTDSATTSEAPDAAALAPGEQGAADTGSDVAANGSEGQEDQTELEAGSDGATGDDVAEVDTEDYEHEGKSLKVPKALIPLLMTTKDYTQKTQALAERSRAIETDYASRYQTLAQREQALSGAETAAKTLAEERTDLQISVRALQQFDTAINEAWQKGDREGMSDLQWQRQGWQTQHDAAKAKVDDAEAKLAEEKGKLSSTAQAERQAAFARGAQALASDPVIQLTPAKFEQIVAGLGRHQIPAELVMDAVASSPQVVRFAAVALDAMDKAAKYEAAEKARKGAPPVSAQPVKTANGANAGANARKTTDSSGDGLSMEEWARRERARTAAAHA